MHPVVRSDIQLGIAARLRKRLLRRNACRAGLIELRDLGRAVAHNVARVERLRERLGVNRRHRRVDEPAAIQLTQNRHHAARPMHVFHVVVARRSDLAQRRDSP